MATPRTVSLEPRKQPRQARSQVTVGAILEAGIQVLLSDGPRRLTTTSVAERAGVSVGTLYQYFPNKQALLHAVSQRHLDRVAQAVETAALGAHGAPLAVMVGALVEAFVRAKTERLDESRALYAVAGELPSVELVAATARRGIAAISAMLATAPDAGFGNLPLVSYMVAAAITGPTRAMVEGGAPPKMLRALAGQLESLCLGYLEREALGVGSLREAPRALKPARVTARRAAARR